MCRDVARFESVTAACSQLGMLTIKGKVYHNFLPFFLVKINISLGPLKTGLNGFAI